MDETTETTVTLNQAALDHVLATLDRELAGHHNRAEGYLVGDLSGLPNSVELATDCMRAAHRTRQVRALFLRAQRERVQPVGTDRVVCENRWPSERDLNEAHGV